MPDDLDKLLRQYLADEARGHWREEIRSSVARLADQALETTSTMRAGFSEVHADLKLIKAEQAYVGRRLDALEEREEITGVEHVASLRRKLDSERARASAWKSWVLRVAAGLIIALVTTGAALAIDALTR